MHYLLEVLIANQELEKILPEVRKQAEAQTLPADLCKRVAKQFEKTPDRFSAPPRRSRRSSRTCWRA